MIECPACQRPAPDTAEYCECGSAFYRRSTDKIILLTLGLGILGVLAGWFGGIMWSCGVDPATRSGGHSMCGLVVFVTVPAGGLIGAILGALTGWFWRSRTTPRDL